MKAPSSVAEVPAGLPRSPQPEVGIVFRRSGWLLLGYVTRLVFQLVVFVLLARTLGPEGFGAFAGTLAVVGLLGPLVELGGYSLIVRDVAAGMPTARAVGNSFLVVIGLLPVGLLALVMLKMLVLPKLPWTLVLALGLADFVGGRVVSLVNAAHVAHALLWRNAVIEVLAGIVRLSLVLTLARLGGSVQLWGFFHLTQLMIVAAIALIWFSRTWGVPRGSPGEARSRLQPGVHFAVGVAASQGYTDLDKALLTRLATLEAAGVYGAAYRILYVALLPLMALLAATYPRFFNAGRQGLAPARRLTFRILPVTVGYGVLTAAALWFGAPLLPVVLGREFSGAVDALRLLAFLPLLQAFLFPIGDALSGTNLQHVRARGQILALGLNLGLNILMIPSLGWRGAGYAALLTQGAVLAYNALAVAAYERTHAADQA